MLESIHLICAAHNIPYWLTDGTLLGSVRHQGFIPWDDDVDVGILRTDYEKFLRIIEKELPAPYHIQTLMTGKCNWLKIFYLDDFKWVDTQGRPCYGLCLDVFPFDYVHKKNLLQEMVHRITPKHCPDEFNEWRDLVIHMIHHLKIPTLYSKLNKKSDTVTYGIDTRFFRHALFDIDKIFPLKTTVFEGKTFAAPNDPHYYLTKLYGDYMTIPEKEDRMVHMFNLRFKESLAP